MNCWERYRAEGYTDGYSGRPDRRLMFPPEGRSFYDNGRRDGLAVRVAPSKKDS